MVRLLTGTRRHGGLGVHVVERAPVQVELPLDALFPPLVPGLAVTRVKGPSCLARPLEPPSVGTVRVGRPVANARSESFETARLNARVRVARQAGPLVLRAAAEGETA